MNLMPYRFASCMHTFKHRIFFAGLMAFVFVLCPLNVHANEGLSQINQTVTQQGGVYTTPDKKFSIYIPPDAQILKTDASVDLAMQSRSGWSINIQSSRANHVLNLEQMVGHFESKYVGPDKPWSQKLSGQTLDQNSYSGQYEGSGTRIVMIIKRTPLWDFVLMFMAPDDAFVKSNEVFHRVLKSFTPLATEVSLGNVEHSEGETISETGSNDSLSTQSNRFHDPTLGYALSYPANWVATKPDDFTVVFSGQVGTDPGYVAVSIRNVTTTASLPPQGIAEGMLQQLKAQMAYNDANVRHDRSVEIVIGQGEQQVHGMQMLSTFNRSGIDFRQWSVVAPRQEIHLAHVWTYTAPLDRFDRYQAVAEKMAGSLTFLSAMAPDTFQ